jgi:hypothetical protein
VGGGPLSGRAARDADTVAPMRLVTLDVLAPFPARLLAARLGAEGIVWQLRGESSVYPFGSVEVLVEAEAVERAREVAGLEPLPVLDSASEPIDHPARRWVRAWLWLAVLALVLGLALRVVHVG